MAFVFHDDDGLAFCEKQDLAWNNLDSDDLTDVFTDGIDNFRAQQRDKGAGFCSGTFRARCEGQ